MLVTIWNGKTYNSIIEAETALSALQRDYIDSLFFLIRNVFPNKEGLDLAPFLEIVDNISNTNRDIKKLKNCRKWVQD